MGVTHRMWAAALAAVILLASSSCAVDDSQHDTAETIGAPTWGDGLVDHQAGFRLSHVKVEGGSAGRVRFEVEVGHARIAELTSWYWSKDLRYFERAPARPTPDGAWETSFPDSPGGPGHLVVAFDSGDEELGELFLGTDVVGPRAKHKAPAARVTDGDVQKVGAYDIALSGDLLLAQPSKLTISVSSAGKQVKFAEPQVAAVSVASGAFTRFDPESRGTFSGTPSSPGEFRVMVDVTTADGPLQAVFGRTVFG